MRQAIRLVSPALATACNLGPPLPAVAVGGPGADQTPQAVQVHGGSRLLDAVVTQVQWCGPS